MGISLLISHLKIFENKFVVFCMYINYCYFCARVSLIRPAPVKSPQVRKEARVNGCSGAM